MERAVRRRGMVVASTVVSLLLLSGCGGGEEREAAGESTAWSLPAPAEASGEELALSQLAGQEPRDPVGEEAAGAPVFAVTPSPALAVEPCDLLDLESWRAWAGKGAAAPILLEHGAACGSVGPGDRARIALRVVPHGNGYSYLRPAEQRTAERVGTPAPGFWLTRSPVPGSDQLVVAIDDGAQLVVEVSDRTGKPAADRREVAETIATEALSRLRGDR